MEGGCEPKRSRGRIIEVQERTKLKTWWNKPCMNVKGWQYDDSLVRTPGRESFFITLQKEPIELKKCGAGIYVG